MKLLYVPIDKTIRMGMTTKLYETHNHAAIATIASLAKTVPCRGTFPKIFPDSNNLRAAIPLLWAAERMILSIDHFLTE